MARWRSGPVAEIPAWVFDPVFAAEADAWLDDLYERDPGAWWDVFVTIISTPTYTVPPDG